jgi:S1-C subfamily serine protease
LRQGDVLVSIHGRPIRSDADFHRWVVYHPGRPVPVVILRDGRQETIYVTYEDDMADADVVYEEQPVADMQGYLGVSFDANARNAAIVSVVAPNSPAEHAGLRQGDMIVALNGQPVDSYQQAIEVIASMRPGDRLGIDFARRQEDKTQAVLASKPGQGPRAAALPRDEVRVYQEDRANISIENEGQINRQNNRRLLNREPADRRSGDRPLLPRLRN